MIYWNVNGDCFERYATGLGTHIANAICNKNCCCCTALLSCTCDVRHANADDQADDWPKESNQSVSDDWSSSLTSPGASPYDGTSGDYWEAAEDQEYEAYVGYSTGEITCDKDEGEAYASKWELEEYRVESGPALVNHISQSNGKLRPAAYPNVDTMSGPKPLTAPLTVYLEWSADAVSKLGVTYAAAIMSATSQILMSNAASRI